MSRRAPALVAVLSVPLVAVLVGCTAAPESDANAVVSLRLATDDSPGDLVSSQQIQHFADRVAELSGDSLIVEPDWAANGDLEHDWDQAAAQLVIDGTDELGMIPSRAWDALGVTSLQAISTPMLITDEQLSASVASGDLADELLSGLADVGVDGLALVPESLRHPFGIAAALLAPDDFVGGTVRVPTSEASTLLYSALGATTTESDTDDGSLLAYDSDYGREPPGTATGNLVWYPKVNVLIGNADALDGLSEEQRDWLLEAADDTREWAVDNNPTDAEAAAAWCSLGGTIAATSDADLEAFAAAVAPVRQKLAGDPLTAEIIAAVDELKAAHTPEAPVTACPAT